MIVKRTSFSLIIAAILTLGLEVTVIAETMQQRVVPNASADALTASLDGDSRMNVFEFSGTASIATGTLTILVRDDRGANTGWSVTLDSGNFHSTAENATAIPARGFYVASDAGISSEIGATDGISVVNTGVPLNTGTRVLQAAEGAGTGVYAQELNVRLEIPAWQPVGEYRSDITVTIASGPGGTGI